MTTDHDLRNLERAAYSSSYSDGIIDLYLGLSIVWLGTAWIWRPDLAGLAGILPAVLVVPVLMGRQTFLERRTGYVKWTEPRRKTEHRSLLGAAILGILLFALAIGAFLVVRRTSFDTGIFEAIAPALMAWLLALMTLVLAVVMTARRMIAYAAVLVVTGIVGAAFDANPGWPMLVSGLVIVAVGGSMLVSFLRVNPTVES